MNTQNRSRVWSLVAVTMVSLVGVGSAFAGPVQPRLRPLVPPPVNHPATPRLGIMGHMQFHRGMLVDSVNRGSTAARMGLERGDLIVQINEQQVNSDRNYQEALSHAIRFHKGFVDLTVVDVRSGRTAHRTGRLETGFPNSQPRFAPHFSASIGSY